MTEGEKNIIQSLIAVAWADGRIDSSEVNVVEGLLVGLDANPDEERELMEYARVPRTLAQDLPVKRLSEDDRELLLANAALLTLADGRRTFDEARVLTELVGLLGIEHARAEKIIGEAQDGALRLSERALG